MVERDLQPFTSMLDDVLAFYPQAKPPTAGQKAMFFRALAEFTIAQVRAGFDAHVKDPQRGRFPPMPADVVAQIDAFAKLDGRPGPEEAWAIAVLAADETRTIVWSEEIAAAWGIAKAVHDQGDDVGARMAFKDAYNRLVANARRENKPTVWSPTVGTDPEQRDHALSSAHIAGRLSAPERLRELPAPNHALSGHAPGMPEHIRERLAAVKARILGERTTSTDDKPQEAPRYMGPFNLPPLPQPLQQGENA